MVHSNTLKFHLPTQKKQVQTNKEISNVNYQAHHISLDSKQRLQQINWFYFDETHNIIFYINIKLVGSKGKALVDSLKKVLQSNNKDKNLLLWKMWELCKKRPKKGENLHKVKRSHVPCWIQVGSKSIK